MGNVCIGGAFEVSTTGILVCMYVCMYVVIPYSKLHDNFSKMQTHTCPRMPCIILVIFSTVIVTR